MSVPRLYRRGRRRLVPLAGVAVAAVAIVVGAQPVQADTTIVYDEAGDAAHISIIGDSTLAGVRWYDEYGELERYNFVFDAESCRRTVATSCWSREDIRAESALVTMQRLSGQLGEVLVVMSGYNDPGYGFDESVDGIVAEARRQGIPTVIWLTLRTTEVNYEEPLHLANANTYREANHTLYAKAEEYGGYLQVADWSTHSAERSEWFEYDGVHLTIEGVHAITTYMADQAGLVLAGTTITAEYPPWAELEPGDNGDTVILAQEALIESGIDITGGADGIYGDATEAAVTEFQNDNGLAATGTVDEATAAALGIHEVDPALQAPAPAPVAADPEPASVEPPEVAGDAAASTDEADGDGGTPVSRPVAIGGLVVAAAAAAVVARRRHVVATRRARAGVRPQRRELQRRAVHGGRRRPQHDPVRRAHPPANRRPRSPATPQPARPAARLYDREFEDVTV